VRVRMEIMSKINKHFYAFQFNRKSSSSVKAFVKLMNQISFKQSALVADLERFMPDTGLTRRLSQCGGYACGSSPCSSACYWGERREIGLWLAVAARQMLHSEATIGLEFRYLGRAAAAGELHRLDVRACGEALSATLREAECSAGAFLASALITPRFDVWPDGRREWRLVYYTVLSAAEIYEEEARLRKAVAGTEFADGMSFYSSESEIFDWSCVAPIPEGEQLVARPRRSGKLKWYAEPLPPFLNAEYARWLDETPLADRMVIHGHDRLPPIEADMAEYGDTRPA